MTCIAMPSNRLLEAEESIHQRMSRLPTEALCPGNPLKRTRDDYAIELPAGLPIHLSKSPQVMMSQEHMAVFLGHAAENECQKHQAAPATSNSWDWSSFPRTNQYQSPEANASGAYGYQGHLDFGNPNTQTAQFTRNEAEWIQIAARSDSSLKDLGHLESPLTQNKKIRCDRQEDESGSISYQAHVIQSIASKRYFEFFKEKQPERKAGELMKVNGNSNSSQGTLENTREVIDESTEILSMEFCGTFHKKEIMNLLGSKMRDRNMNFDQISNERLFQGINTYYAYKESLLNLKRSIFSYPFRIHITYDSKNHKYYSLVMPLHENRNILDEKSEIFRRIQLIFLPAYYLRLNYFFKDPTIINGEEKQVWYLPDKFADWIHSEILKSENKKNAIFGYYKGKIKSFKIESLRKSQRFILRSLTANHTDEETIFSGLCLFGYWLQNSNVNFWEKNFQDHTTYLNKVLSSLNNEY